MTKPALTGCGPFGASEGLAEVALGHLRDTFTGRNHNPGPNQWRALTELLATMESMANGTATPNVFLASLDPGVGKSSSVIAFARALVASPQHRETGMLVCVGRIEEAKALVREMTAAGIGNHVAAYFRDGKEAAELSPVAPGAAQILVVMQQKMEHEARRAAFKDIDLFHYHGQARPVRVWDEAWLPGATITLDRAELGGLFRAASKISRAFYSALEDMFTALRTVPDGELFPVPDWTELTGVTETDLLARLSTDDVRLAASVMFILAGRSIRVKREAYNDTKNDRVLISFRDTLPEDLSPLLVLDASIRVRQTYQDAIRHRGVIPLAFGEKDYSPLTVHLWKTGGGKTSWRTNSDQLIEGIVRTVLTKPDEDWLIVTHKPERAIKDIQRRIRRELPQDMKPLLRFLHWGSHMATNEHKDCRNVILAGTLFMPECHYLSLTHLAQNKKPEVEGLNRSGIGGDRFGQITQPWGRGPERRRTVARPRPA